MLTNSDSNSKPMSPSFSVAIIPIKTVPACEYYTLLALVNGMKIKLKVKSFMRIIEYNLMNSQSYLSLTVHRITFAAQPLVYQGRLCRSQSYCSMAVMSLVVARHAFSD